MIEVQPIARKQDKSYEIDNINKDLGLLKTFTHNILEEHVTKSEGPRSMKQLAQILKNRNSKFNFNDVKRQKSKQWLKKNGISFDTLTNKIQDQQRKHEQQSTFISSRRQFEEQLRARKHVESRIISPAPSFISTRMPQLSYENFTLNNQDNYLQLQQDLFAKQLVCQSIKSLSKKASFAERLLQQRLINKINGRQYFQELQYEDFEDGYDSQHQAKHRSQKLNIKPDTLKDNIQVRIKYMRTVDMVVNSKSYDKFTEQFWKTSVGTFYQQFWAIKYYQQKQIENVLQQNQYLSEQQALVIMMIKSLTMVQQQFEKQLNINLEILEKRFSQGELRRQSSWQLAYLYYKSGCKRQFYQILSSKNLLKMVNLFHKYDRSVAQGRPQPQHNGDVLIENSSFYSKNQSRSKTKQLSDLMNKDVHYQQLVYILQGQPIFSDEIICDPWTYDAAWIILRNAGIHLDAQEYSRYIEKYNKYLEIIQSLSRLYEKNIKQITQVSLKNMLYVCAYKQTFDLFNTLVKSSHNYIKVSDKFDTKKQISQEFVLHFMIALYYNRHPFLKSQHYKNFVENTLPQKLSQLLVSFICDLLQKQTKNMKNKEKQQHDCGQAKHIQNYILLIPIERLSESLKKIVSTMETYKSLNWSYIFQYYAQLGLQETFSKAIEGVLSNILKNSVLTEEQQIYLVSYLKNYQTQLECYLYIFMCKILKKQKKQQKQNTKEQKIKKSFFDVFLTLKTKSIQEELQQEDSTSYQKNVGEVSEQQLQNRIQQTISEVSTTGIDYQRIFKFLKSVCQLKKIVVNYIGHEDIGRSAVKNNQKLINFIQNSDIQNYLPSYKVDLALQALLTNIQHMVTQYWNRRIEKINQKQNNSKIFNFSNYSKIKIYYRYLQLLYVSYDIIYHSKNNPNAVQKKHREIQHIFEAVNDWEKQNSNRDL